MSTDFPKQLDRTQRWMQAVVTHAEGIASGIALPEAQSFIPIALSELEQVITRSNNLTAAERLAVYHNAYFARLLACLREEFPILVQTITEDVFDAFASDYLEKHPSRSYTLGHLGAAFASYLTETWAREKDPSSEPGWEEFVIDLATLEWTYGEVFDGPGVEDQEPFDVAAFAARSPDDWLAARLTPVPCLRLLSLRFPAHQFYADARKHAEALPPGPAPTCLAISRRDYVVRHVELSATEFDLLAELMRGTTIGAALETLARRPSFDPDALERDLGEWFRRWASEGFFQAAWSENN